MPEITDEILVAGGALNYDDNPLFFEKGDSTFRLNIIPFQKGNTYVLSNLKGNTQYQHAFSHGSSYAGSTYKVVGDVYDDNRNAVYYFIHSTGGNDSILRFNFSDQSFDKIAWDHTDLGLDPDYPITDGFMIGDWLHYNPRTTSPRSINVQWAYYDFVTYTPLAGQGRVTGDLVRYFNRVYRALQNSTSGTPPTVPADYEFVNYCYEDTYPVNGTALDATVTSGSYFRYRNFYNIPTLLPYTLTSAVGTDTNYEYNNIRGRRFQFAYRHYVKDQGYTISSSFTDIVAPPSSETNTGEVEGNIQSYNKIAVGFPVQSSDVFGLYWYKNETLFEFVEVLVREGPDDRWKVAERISYSTVVSYIISTGNSYYPVGFFNDRAYEAVDTVSIQKQYNTLPIKADAQWSLDGLRSAYGGVTEGLEANVELDFTFTVGERELTLDKESGAIEATHSFTGEFSTEQDKWYYYTGTISNSGAGANELLKCTSNGIDYYKTLSAGDVATANDYTDAIVDLLGQAGITAIRASGPIVEYYLSNPLGAVLDVYRYGATATDDLSYKVGSFKNGAWHPFCLFYYDVALRVSEPVFNDDMRIYVTTLPEEVPGSSTNYQRYVDWTIAHEAPSWAKYWRWGYAGNQTIAKFWQYNVSAISSETKGSGADTWTQLNISPLQNLANDTDTALDHYFPDSEIEIYSYEPGDRVRFITTSIDKPATYDLLQVSSETKDYDVKEYDDVNHYLYIDDLQAPSTTTTTVAGADDETVIIEIYRPKKQVGTTTYYEYGELKPVYQNGYHYYHRGGSVDQTNAIDAGGQFNTGDVFVITRLFSLTPFTTATEPVFVESYSWSDFHLTDGWGKGKSGVFTGIGQRKLNNVRYSNKYEPNRNTSGLSTFDPSDFIPLSSDHGLITAMRQAGNTLKVYFERNTAAVLVNKTQFYNADGTSQVLKSDKVLGDVVYSNYHYGTIFPESVFLKDRTVYFFDVYRKAFIRDSPNGLEPISDYKMSRYFDEQSIAIQSSGVGSVSIHTTYDYDLDMLLVHFVVSSDGNDNECVMFHEPSNKWVSFLQVADYVRPVWTTTTTLSSDQVIVFGKGAMNLISFVGEDVWIHNTNETYNNLWGNQRDSIVHIISNEVPTVKKVFESLSIHSDKAWDVEWVDIPSDSTYVNGMQSKVPESRFILREGIFSSDYLRNMKTHQSTVSSLDLVRGESLRGYYLEHRLVNDDTTEVVLYKVDVNSSVSKI